MSMEDLARTEDALPLSSTPAGELFPVYGTVRCYTGGHIVTRGQAILLLLASTL